LHFDGGIGIVTQYYNKKYYSSLQFLWAVNLSVKL
jgi:hypothetical protein